jgi:uncharacterized membrane protein YtjA (UPF0391 family)
MDRALNELEIPPDAPPLNLRPAAPLQVLRTWKGGRHMLKWALIFAIVAVVAGLLGFGGIAGAAAGIAKFLFFAAIALFVLFLVLGAAVFKKLS